MPRVSFYLRPVFLAKLLWAPLYYLKIIKILSLIFYKNIKISSKNIILINVSIRGKITNIFSLTFFKDIKILSKNNILTNILINVNIIKVFKLDLNITKFKF